MHVISGLTNLFHSFYFLIVRDLVFELGHGWLLLRVCGDPFLDLLYYSVHLEKIQFLVLRNRGIYPFSIIRCPY